MGRIDGFHHVKLPVSDVSRSRAWYEQVLGFETAIEFVEDGVVMGVAMTSGPTGAQVALRHDLDRATALAGFDPIALSCPHPEDVREWAEHLDRLGVPHGGVTSGHGGGSVLVGLRDPDGIEIRLYAEPPEENP